MAFCQVICLKKISGTLFLESCKLVSVIAPFGLEMPEPIYKPFVLVNNANLPDSLSFSLNAWFSFSEETEKGTKMLVAFERGCYDFFHVKATSEIPLIWWRNTSSSYRSTKKTSISPLGLCALWPPRPFFICEKQISSLLLLPCLRRNYTSFPENHLTIKVLVQ